MDSKKCPICNKTDIPDFLKEDVVCPCCNSDLSIFRKLYLLENEKKGKRNKKRFFIPLMIIVVIIFCFVYAIHSPTNNDINILNEQIVQKDAEIIQLKDSLEKFKSTIKTADIQENSAVWYIVKPGDSFSKISKFVYGTEIQYKRIVQLNNLQDNTMLLPGDSIRIK